MLKQGFKEEVDKVSEEFKLSKIQSYVKQMYAMLLDSQRM